MSNRTQYPPTPTPQILAIWEACFFGNYKPPLELAYVLASQWFFDRCVAMCNVVSDTVIAKIVDVTTQGGLELRAPLPPKRGEPGGEAIRHTASGAAHGRKSIWEATKADPRDSLRVLVDVNEVLMRRRAAAAAGTTATSMRNVNARPSPPVVEGWGNLPTASPPSSSSGGGGGGGGGTPDTPAWNGKGGSGDPPAIELMSPLSGVKGSSSGSGSSITAIRPEGRGLQLAGTPPPSRKDRFRRADSIHDAQVYGPAHHGPHTLEERTLHAAIAARRAAELPSLHHPHAEGGRSGGALLPAAGASGGGKEGGNDAAWQSQRRAEEGGATEHTLGGPSFRPGGATPAALADEYTPPDARSSVSSTSSDSMHQGDPPRHKQQQPPPHDSQEGGGGRSSGHATAFSYASAASEPAATPSSSRFDDGAAPPQPQTTAPTSTSAATSVPNPLRALRGQAAAAAGAVVPDGGGGGGGGADQGVGQWKPSRR